MKSSSAKPKKAPTRGKSGPKKKVVRRKKKKKGKSMMVIILSIGALSLGLLALLALLIAIG